MNAIDALVLAAVVGVGTLCWAEGLVRAVWGYSGLVLGTALGLLTAPLVLVRVELSVWTAMAALCFVGVTALVVRALVLRVGRRVGRVARWRPPHWLDRPGGLVFGVVVALGVSWMIGLALAGSTVDSLAAGANRSVVLRALDRVPLPWSTRLAGRLSEIGEESDFPRYVDVFTATRIVDVPPPRPGVVREPGVVRASRSVWKIYADEAVFTQQGTGFLVAPERVMTAAHVVGGARRITVETPEGDRSATVVACDPRQDVAVLHVPGATGRVLAFTDGVGGDPAAVVGYPADGPLELQPARIRARQPWQSADIWGEGRHEHDAYSVRGRIRSGDSGGPLVTPRGEVLGVVVASSRVDDSTGFVLTREQVAGVLEDSRRAGSDPRPTTCGG
ncbi:MarP family serine protease [Nocardioides solisilvae]|uniref:MarP family serine protease n=1 Tax=Nocardioides solisilvae TaxID=1542435 RepID=UPI000D74A5D4|nr:MarP family serine protease [Nocardioides solisilvae]